MFSETIDELLDGGHKVLVDSLLRPDYLAKYNSRSDVLHADLIGSRPPFDGVDLVLVTHMHTDHINADAALAHLVSNPGAVLVGPASGSARSASAARWKSSAR